MTAATLLFLPTDEGQPWRWWRIVDDAITDEGEGAPLVQVDGDTIIAVAPADAVTLHRAELPARSGAQAIAAARVVVSDATATPSGNLHVAIGPEQAGERAIAVVAPERMAGWLAAMAARGIDPVAMIPAPLLLPEPESGYVRAGLAGHAVVRGRSTGWADEARLTELVTAGDTPVTLARDVVHAAAVAAAGLVPLDLRQGVFARRRRRAIDWPLVRRLAVLTGMILLATLAIDLVRIARYSLGADTIEARAATIARQGLPRGTGDNSGDAARLLDDRLSRLRGPGQGFSRTAGAVYDIVRAVPEAEVTALQFEPSGALRVSMAVANEAQANMIRSRLEAGGFRVTTSVFQAANGRLTGDVTVQP